MYLCRFCRYSTCENISHVLPPKVFYVLMGIGRAVYESTNKAIFADFFPGEAGQETSLDVHVVWLGLYAISKLQCFQSELPRLSVQASAGAFANVFVFGTAASTAAFTLGATSKVGDPLCSSGNNVYNIIQYYTIHCFD